MVEENKRLTLEDIISGLNSAPREGAAKDRPEGSRYIRISDTLANEIAESLVDIETKTRELTLKEVGELLEGEIAGRDVVLQGDEGWCLAGLRFNHIVEALKQGAQEEVDFVPFLARLTPEKLADFRHGMAVIRRKFRRRMKRRHNNQVHGRPHAAGKEG